MQKNGRDNSQKYDNIPASKTSIDLFLKETETPEGYTPDEEVHQLTWTKADYDAQTDDGNTDGELKSFGDIVNKSIWTIKYYVKKVDEEQNALADVKFKIYTDCSAQINLAGSQKRTG